MSLTQELRNPSSAMSRWLDENFDLEDAIRKFESQAGTSNTIKPDGNLKDYPWTVVGSAVEFRIRQNCGTDYYGTSAALGDLSRFGACQFHDALAILWEEHKAE